MCDLTPTCGKAKHNWTCDTSYSLCLCTNVEILSHKKKLFLFFNYAMWKAIYNSALAMRVVPLMSAAEVKQSRTDRIHYFQWWISLGAKKLTCLTPFMFLFQKIQEKTQKRIFVTVNFVLFQGSNHCTVAASTLSKFNAHLLSTILKHLFHFSAAQQTGLIELCRNHCCIVVVICLVVSTPCISVCLVDDIRLVWTSSDQCVSSVSQVV